MQRYLHALLALIFMVGCLSEKNTNHALVTIVAELPSEFASVVDMSEANIVLTNIQNGVSYKAKCDASGKAVFNAEYGFYEASLQYKLTVAGVMSIFNGRLENIQLYPGKDTPSEYTLNLIVAQTSQLIIKEFYYFGCKKDDNTNYSHDCYVTIYNNSDEVAYLDCLCLGMVNPMTSNSESKWKNANGELMDTIPMDQMAWSFPGNGTDYPLLPGNEVCIAYSAINHKAVHSNSIDLSKADYAFWTDEFDMSSTSVQQPALGVKYLNCMWRRSNTTKAFPIMTTAKALVLFRIPGMSPRDYGDNPVNAMLQPNSTGTLLYLIVHKDWILDGIECVTSASQAYKRLHPAEDAGYCYIEEGTGSSLAVIRKVEEEIDGRVVYADTNNSTEDMEKGTPTWKNK